MEVGFSRTDKSGGLPISSIYNYYIKANIAMKKYPICSMVLEYLSPFVLKNHPNVGEYTSTMEHMGILELSMLIF